MIFLAIHTHAAERCPVNSPDIVRKFQKSLSEESARKNGCRLIGVYVVPTEHVAYIFFEADEHKDITSFLRPLMRLGQTRITPVEEWKHVAEQLQRYTSASAIPSPKV